MAANVTIAVDVTDLGQEVNKRNRFTTENTPEAISMGYGTIAAALTYEALPMGQVAASVVDMVYLKSIDNTIYVAILTSTTTHPYANIVIPAGETACFRPGTSLGTSTTAVSILMLCGTAESQYEYTIIGQSS